MIFFKRNVFILLIFFFFIKNFFFLKHGLPYFLNSDEIAFAKSSLYFLGYFLNFNGALIDPYSAPLLNALFIGIIGLFYNLFFLKLNFSELSLYFYNYPDEFIYLGRLSSLFVSSFAVLIFYLILKKLKINSLISVIITLIFCNSYAFNDIAINNGKNSYSVFFYLFQYLLFLNYLINIKKFTIKSYIIFLLIGSLATGINYWNGLISVYSIIFLHFKKFKFKNKNYLILFFIFFFFFGFVPTFMFSADNIFNHVVGSENTGSYNTYLSSVLEDISLIIKIFLNFEFISLILFLIFIFLHLKNLIKINKSIFFSILFFSLEPLILIILSKNVTAQLRYFLPTFSLIFIFLAIFLDKFKNSKFFLVFIFLILIDFSIKIYNEFFFFKIAKSEFIQYQSINNFKNSEEKVFLDFGDIFFREDNYTLLLYKDLIQKNIIKNKQGLLDKNSLDNINKKLNFYKNNNINSNRINSNNITLTSLRGNYDIANYDQFILFLKKEGFRYYITYRSNNDFTWNIFVKNNFIVRKVFSASNLENLRTLVDVKNYKNLEKIKNIGFDVVVYEIK